MNENYYCDKCYQPYYENSMRMQNEETTVNNYAYAGDKWSDYDKAFRNYVTEQEVSNRHSNHHHGHGQPPKQPNPFPTNNTPSGMYMPTTPPPEMAPQRSAQTFRVDAGSMQNCMFRNTYIWQNNGDEYWMFPVQLTRTTVSGFRFNRRFGWSFFGVSLKNIEAFMCH